MKPGSPAASPAKPRPAGSPPPPPESRRSLRSRLEEAEQALAAIRSGDVDAVVVGGPLGERVFTLSGADHGYRVLMEAMSEGVATLGDQGLITYCNARFAHILGQRLERLIGSPMAHLVPGTDRARFVSLLDAAARGRADGEFWLHAPDAGPPALVRLAVVTLMMDGAGTHCVVMTDLTEKRRRLAEVASERALLEKRLLLAERMASLGTLAAGVAHEINNPLSFVLTSLDLMSDQLPELAASPPGPAQEAATRLRRQVDRARDGAERVRLIVRGLKAFSRADDETMGAIDPRRALDTAIRLVNSEIRHKARLVTEYRALPLVWANEARLEQVLVNLLVNATQAIPAGEAARHEIEVGGWTDAEGRAVIEVRDSGCGIPAADLPLIFDPFFTTKPLNVGTGLGLSLCHAVVTSSGGHITVESAPGTGTVFRILLPGTGGGVLAPEVPIGVEATTEPRRRVLFIDDEADLCEAVQEALGPRHEVVTATGARRALDLLAAGQRFDLILCDVRMPEMTGLEFLAQLEAQHPDEVRRVILMSGGYHRRPEDPPAALAGKLLEKPFGIERLRALVRGASPREPGPGGGPT